MKLRWRIALLCGALISWTVAVVALSFYGLWMRPAVAPGDTEAFTEWAADSLSQGNPGTHALALVEHREPFSSRFGGPQPIDAETLFATASFSKWIAALTVMSLVEEGLVDLDTPASTYLRRWQLPDSEFDNGAVTVRRLLSHTGGLTDGLGFGDYLPDETVPDLVESLRAPRASSGDSTVAVGLAPGSEFRYSGGGYLILELLVEEVTGQTFAEVARERLLKPLGMQRSTHGPLAEQENASLMYAPDGQVGPSYRYASAAATGFASSTADLLRLVTALLQTDGQAPLSAASLQDMRRPEASVLGAPVWGLGTMLYAETTSGDYIFGHDGANDPGINTAVRLSPETGDAIIVLVSGSPGLASSIAGEWVLWQTGMPDVLSSDRALASARLPWLIGTALIILCFLLWGRSLARRN